jgi:hypothetical protein
VLDINTISVEKVYREMITKFNFWLKRKLSGIFLRKPLRLFFVFNFYVCCL